MHFLSLSLSLSLTCGGDTGGQNGSSRGRDGGCGRGLAGAGVRGGGDPYPGEGVS